jgi:hypothetical protein
MESPGCVCPVGNGRCANACESGKLHCSIHAPMAYKEYMQYKTYEKKIVGSQIGHVWTDPANLPSALTDKSCSELIHIYAILERAYTKRYNYRMRFFVKSCWDKAHDNFMSYIQRCMLICDKHILAAIPRDAAEADYIVSDKDEEYNDDDRFWEEISHPTPKLTKQMAIRKKQIMEDRYWDNEIDAMYKEYRRVLDDIVALADSIIDQYPRLSSYCNKYVVFEAIVKFIATGTICLRSRNILGLARSAGVIIYEYTCSRNNPIEHLNDYLNEPNTVRLIDHIMDVLVSSNATDLVDAMITYLDTYPKRLVPGNPVIRSQKAFNEYFHFVMVMSNAGVYDLGVLGKGSKIILAIDVVKVEIGHRNKFRHKIMNMLLAGCDKIYVRINGEYIYCHSEEGLMKDVIVEDDLEWWLLNLREVKDSLVEATGKIWLNSLLHDK